MSEVHESEVKEAGAHAGAVQEHAHETKAKSKSKHTGDIILDTASEIENLTKLKALNYADQLAEKVEVEYFRLGGVLKVIFDNAWFEGYESFGAFVAARFGFQERKARYLMEIYEALVSKQIPYEKVKGLGWTKLKELAKILTLENVDEWVAKAGPASVSELQAMIKAQTPAGEKGSATSSDVETFKVKLKKDQIEVVHSALSKAKADAQTEYDNVALERICGGYIAGVTGIAATFDPKSWIAEVGWHKALEMVNEAFPKLDINVVNPE